MKKFIVEDFIASRKLAVIDDGKLEKLIIEEKNDLVSLKSIYRARVQKKIATMDACFLDIGEKNPAYLKFSKEDDIKEGDNLLVQVIKEEKGEKRVKLSREIDFSGKYLIYIPSKTKISFSNKIKDLDEKKRLKKLLLEASQGEKAFILRTEAQGASLEDLKKEVASLREKYKKVMKSYGESFYPKLLYKQEGKLLSYIRDNLGDDIKEIIYPDGDFDRCLRQEVKAINPAYLEILKREKNIDIFEAYGVNNMLKKYISKNVWLKSGAYIVIEKTEAMTVIDVNTGRFKGKSGYEDTVFRSNLEAADEIVRQVSMRDISGIIIVDFIDMASKENQKALLERLEHNFQREDRPFKVHGFTRLGLVEISRMRKAQSFEQYLKSDSRKLDLIESKVIYEKYHLGKEEIGLDLSQIDFEKIADSLEKLQKKYQVRIEPLKK